MNRPTWSAGRAVPWSCLLAVLLAASAEAPPRRMSPPTLAGEREPVVAERGGKDFSVAGFPGAVLRLTTDGDAPGDDRGSYTLPPGGLPASIDVRGVDGPNAGRTIPAIDAFAGDRLTICDRLGNGGRPAAFESPPGSRVLLVRCRRA